MQCGPPPPFTIYTGDAKTMSLRVASSTGLPVDLSSCTEIIISLPNADGTFTQLKFSMAQVLITSPAVLGQFTASITSLVSALLNVGELQSFNVTFTVGSQVFTVPYVNALSVFETEP